MAHWRMSNGVCRTKGIVVTLFDMQNFFSCVHLAWKWIHQLWTFVRGFFCNLCECFIWIAKYSFTNNKFFAWRKMDTALLTANSGLRLYISSHKKFRNIALKRSTVLSETPKKNEASTSECWRTWRNHITPYRRSSLGGAGIIDKTRLFRINIQNPQFLSVVQSPFDNCHSPFSPTTFFQIGVL